MTNETIASQLAHRTIRAYKDQPLTEEEVTTLMDVARHTATSSFLQSCTVLHITDPTVRELARNRLVCHAFILRLGA